MNIQDALQALGLQAVPASGAAVLRAYTDKAQSIQALLQFPIAGAAKNSLLDELVRLNEARDTLLCLVPPPRSVPSPGRAGTATANRRRQQTIPRPLTRVWSSRPGPLIGVIRCVLSIWRLAKRTVTNILGLTILAARSVRRVSLPAAKWVPSPRLVVVTAATLAAAMAIPLLVLPQLIEETTAGAGDDGTIGETEYPSPRRIDSTTPHRRETSAPPAIKERWDWPKVQFHSWPPSEVYVDGTRYVEAPSPWIFAVKEGTHEIAFVSVYGKRRSFTLYFLPGIHYMLMYNFETGRIQQEVFEQ